MINKYIIRTGIKSTLTHIFLLAVAAACLFPLLWMLRASFMTNQTVFTDTSIIPKEIHFYMFVLAMMIPLPGSFVPLTVLMTQLGFINSAYPVVRQIGYILCMINVGLSLSIILLKTFFDKMPPDLEDAARIDGCSKLGIWFHVALPLARPALAVIVIFNSLNVWNEYILAMLLLNDIGEKTIMPLQRGLMVFSGSHSVDYPLLMAGLTIAVIPIVTICLLMQKHIIKGLTSVAIKG